MREEELNDEIDQIKKEKDPVEADFKRIQAELDKRNEHINSLKGKMSNDKTERDEEK